MEASMHGFGRESAASAAGVPANRATGIRRTRGHARASARRGTVRGDSRPVTARLEHALFALLLGCVGCVWLGALLAEAAQAL